MRVERLRDAIAAVGDLPSAEQLAETLWLACRIAGPHPSGSRSPVVPPPWDEPARPPVRHVERRRTPAAPDPARLDDRERGTARVPLLSAPSPPLPGDTAVEVLVPSAPALDGRLDLQRALRPLKRRVLVRHVDEVDEEATAELIAEQRGQPRRWLPVLRPATGGWLDAAVVIDGGESMTIWRRLARDFWETLWQCGIFRNVTLWRAGETATGDVVVSAAGTRVARHPAELIDPAGRRAILVVSDCVGPTWRSGAFGRTLYRWSGPGPVAVLQPLPERLWSRTGAPTVAGVLGCPAAGAPNVRLRFAPFDGMGSPEGHIPVPVLEMSPPWVRRWARLVGTGAATPAAVTFVSGDQAALPRLAAGPRLSAVDRVRHFRAVASPEAFRLAGYVAMTTPTLPVMQHVHRTMTSQPQPAHLAEVVLSGLLRAVKPGTGEYEFVEDVEEVLLDTVARTDALKVEDLLIRIAERIDASGPGAADLFRALLGIRGGEHAPPPGSRRFALLSGQAGRRLREIPGAAVGVTQLRRREQGEGTTAGPALVASSVDGVPEAAGWRLGGGLVLTAGAGAVEGASVWVREGIGATARQGYVRCRTASGAALVEVPGLEVAELTPVTWGALVTVDHAVPCEVRLPSSTPPVASWLWVREDGGCALELPVSGPVVGAPVFCGDLLAGTVVDPSGGAVAPAAALLRDRACADLLARHGISAHAAPVELGRVLDAALPGRIAVEDLLGPRAAVVRFTDREDELRELSTWCAGSGLSLRLVCGRGGVGKTRLAQELVADLHRADWVAGFLFEDVHETTDLEALARVRAPLLVVLDKADARGAQVRAVVDRVSANRHGYPIRLLLLARSSGEWWESLRQWARAAGTSVVESAAVDRLAALASAPAARRLALTAAAEDFDRAVESLYGPRSWAPDDRTARDLPDLAAARFEHAIELHAEALRVALRRREPHLAEHVRDVVERAAMWRERDYSERAAIEARLSFASADVLDDCVASVHLLGPANASAARHLVVRLLGLTERDTDRSRRFVRWLHDMYPGTGGAYCGPIAPDAVGLRLAEETLGRDPDRLAALLPLATRERAEHLRGLPALREARYPALVAAVSASLVEPEAPPAPVQPAVESTVEREPLVVPEPRPEPPPPARAAPASGNAAARLQQARRHLVAGDRDRALAAAQESIRLFQSLLSLDRPQYLPGLAAALHLLAQVRCERGELDRGARSFASAIDMYHYALEDHPTLVNTLAGVLADRGERLKDWRRDVAIESFVDAATIYRDILRDSPGDEDSRHALVDCYRTLATLLRAAGDGARAQRYARRAEFVIRMIDDVDRDMGAG